MVINAAFENTQDINKTQNKLKFKENANSEKAENVKYSNNEKEYTKRRNK